MNRISCAPKATDRKKISVATYKHKHYQLRTSSRRRRREKKNLKSCKP
jgi:hypothetical protein